MVIWRKNYPRAAFQPVAIIHGVAYNVVDEIIYKHKGLAQWILPGALARHIKYNPNNCPAVIPDSSSPHYFVISALQGKLK